jgi:hypothetical protein
MSYVPLTNSVGLNMVLSAAMDSSSQSAPVQQPQVIVVIGPPGTTVQVPPPAPVREHPVDLFPFVCFAVGILGFATCLASMACSNKVRRRMMIGVAIVWSLTMSYALWGPT